jgi:hypothetical protein
MILNVAVIVVGDPGDVINCGANPDPISYGETTTIIAQITPDFVGTETPDQAEYFVEGIHTIPPNLGDYGNGFQMNLSFQMGWYWANDTFYSNLLLGPDTYDIWAHAHVMPTNVWRAPYTGTLTVEAGASAVTVLQPSGGEFLKGGGQYDIRWSWVYGGDPNDLNADIYYDTNSGGDGYPNPIVSNWSSSLNPSTYIWDPVPSIDSTTVRVKVVLKEADGMGGYNVLANDTSNTDFSIDTVLPHVMSTNPINSDMDVSVSTTITITFDEDMNKSATEAAFTIVPGAIGSFSWPSDDQMMFQPTSDLSPLTLYTVTIDATATDLAGNPLDGNENGSEDGSPTDDYSFSFTTGSAPAPPLIIPLAQGWNLVSIPYEQSDTSITTVLSSIDGEYKWALSYDASDPKDPWKTYDPNRASMFNDLTDINHTMGFWIDITTPGGTSLSVSGDPPSSPTSIPLHRGWNMVGYPCVSNKTRDVALNNLFYGVDITSMKYYNVTQGNLLEIANFDDPVHVGWGFWMFAPSKTDWIVDHV